MDTRENILQMLKDGVITKEESEKLLHALEETAEEKKEEAEQVFELGADIPNTVEDKNRRCVKALPSDIRQMEVEMDVGSLFISPCGNGEAPRVDLFIRRGALKDYRFSLRQRGKNVFIRCEQANSWFRHRNTSACLRVFLPQEQLDRMEVKNNVGDCRLNDVAAKELQCCVNVGNLEVNRCVFRHAEVDVTTGNGKWKENRMNTGKMEVVTGNCIWGSGNQIDEALCLNVTTGSVRFALPNPGSYRLQYDLNLGKATNRTHDSSVMHTVRPEAGFVKLGERGEFSRGDQHTQIEVKVTTGSATFE